MLGGPGVQVWANCRAYNAEGSDICRLAGRLEKQLTAAWRDAGLPRKPSQDAAGVRGSRARSLYRELGYTCACTAGLQELTMLRTRPTLGNIRGVSVEDAQPQHLAVCMADACGAVKQHGPTC